MNAQEQAIAMLHSLCSLLIDAVSTDLETAERQRMAAAAAQDDADPYADADAWGDMPLPGADGAHL